MFKSLDNLNVRSTAPVISPAVLQKHIPVTPVQAALVESARNTVKAILDGTDPRKLVIVGPCSIHDTKAALDYAAKLKRLADDIASTTFVIMRVYFEKPRTTVGWKGLINDPYLNEAFNIEDGLEMARQLMSDITDIGLPIATEALDPITPQYLSDYITWSAIGARTTESQTHREMASGLSYPVGFKNSTDGTIDAALNGIMSARTEHSFLGINEIGAVSIINTRGNAYGHLILRGGAAPNYAMHPQAAAAMTAKNINPAIIIDCSHGNSNKDYTRQSNVFLQVAEDATTMSSLKGFMLESNLVAGNQKLDPNNLEALIYGQSVTDGCIDFIETSHLLKHAHVLWAKHA